MAQVLPQAPPNKASLLAVKPATPATHMAGAHALDSPKEVGKSKFQSMLEHASSSAKIQDPQPLEKLKLPKAKIAEAVVEKSREQKKSDVSPAGAEAQNNHWLSSLGHQPRAEALSKNARPSDSEPGALSLDRNRSPRAERRQPGDGQVPNLANTLGQDAVRLTSPHQTHRSERSEDKPKVVFLDRRTEAKEKEKLKLPGSEAPAQLPVTATAELPASAKVADPKAASSEIQVAFQVSAGKGKEGFDLTPHSGQVPARDAASFQQYLVEKGYGQLVDQARIVLKDQNASEIRMTLYPESLGKVKVSLNLSENSLAGQIFVENQTVKDVFQSNMDGLLQAFRDGGWNDLSLQVSVGGEGGAGTHNQQPETAPQARDYGRQVSQTTVVEGRTDRIGSWNDRQVNLTA